MDTSFGGAFRDKRVLVTGHTGFKGAWLVQWLNELGADVVGAALPAPISEPNLFDIARLDQICRDIRIDIRDSQALAELVAGAKPDLVFHLAAQALVGRGYSDPLTTFSTNVQGTANVLAATLNRGIAGVVIVTSDKVYRNDEQGRAFQETDSLGGRDPYSASKAAAELVVEGSRSLVGIPPLTCVRAGNVIGGGDWCEFRLIPDIVRALETEMSVVLRRPGAVRPWQHVLDCLSGYLECGSRMIMKDEIPNAVNIGPNHSENCRVAELAQRFLRGWGGNLDIVEDPAGFGWEASTLALDSRLARKQLGWCSVLDLSETIDWTIRWHRRYSDGEDARALCQEQITRYQDVASQNRST